MLIDDRRLDEMPFRNGLKQDPDQIPEWQAWIELGVESVQHSLHKFAALQILCSDPVVGILHDRIGHGYACPVIEVDRVRPKYNLAFSANTVDDLFEHLFGQVHQVMIIAI